MVLMSPMICTLERTWRGDAVTVAAPLPLWQRGGVFILILFCAEAWELKRHTVVTPGVLWGWRGGGFGALCIANLSPLLLPIGEPGTSWWGCTERCQ